MSNVDFCIFFIFFLAFTFINHAITFIYVSNIIDLCNLVCLSVLCNKIFNVGQCLQTVLSNSLAPAIFIGT